MKIPECLLKHMKSKGISTPTPIQLQGLPVAYVFSLTSVYDSYAQLICRFSGRDMIGIAFTGSGKTLAFCLPLLMMAAEEEKKLPFEKGEGPCRNRPLSVCKQITSMLPYYCSCGYSANLPIKRMRTSLPGQPHSRRAATRKSTHYSVWEGINMSEQSHVLQKGIHIVVATPGRLKEMLEKKKFNFDSCKYFCMGRGGQDDRSRLRGGGAAYNEFL